MEKNKRLLSLKKIIGITTLLTLPLYAEPVNSAPTITSEAVTSADEDSVYTYAMSANDVNNDDLNWSAVDIPDWLSLGEGSNSTTDFGDAITSPGGVAIDSNGNTYVAELRGDTIWKITPSGTTTEFATVSTSNKYGMLVVDSYLYISYFSANKITRVDLENPSEGESDYISSITDPLAMVFKDGFIYVAQYQPDKISKIDMTDKSVSDYVTTVNNPFGIGFASSGDLYIAKIDNGELVKYDGSTLSAALKTFSSPSDVKIDENDNIYVSTIGSGVKKFSSDLEEETDISTSGNVWGMTINNAGTLIWGINNENKVVKLETGATLTGTPTNDHVGVHDVNLTVSDGTNTVPHNFQITVSNVNDAPIANDFNYTTDIEASAKTFDWKILSNAADVDVGDSIAAAIKSQGSKGTAVVNDTNITYTPNDDVNGTDSFELRIYDTNGSDINITIGVQGIFTHNAPPSITQGDDSNFSIDEDNNYNLELNATDSDSANISWSILTQGSNGTASVDGNGTSNTVSYTPNENYNGSDSFVVQVSDGISTDTITVNVTVDAVNDAPTITSNPVETTAQGEKYTYEVIATDLENDPVSFDVNTDASWLSLGSNGFDFTKIAGGNGYYSYWNNSEDNGDGGLATDAKLYGYGDIVKKDNGDIYFTQGYSIRKINASDGIVNTVAGTGNTNYHTYNSDYEIVDGTATDVNITNAHVMSINPDDGEIYFAECGVIRKFDEDANTITTVVGKNSQGCGYYYGSSSYEDRYKLDETSWQDSNLSGVSDLKFDSAGNMYVKDSYSLVKFAKDGSVATITKRDYDHSYSSSDYEYFEGSKSASEVSRQELQINYFDVSDSGIIYFIGYTYKKYDTSWGTSYYNIPVLGKIENGTVTKIKDLDDPSENLNSEYYHNNIWFSGLEVGEDGNIYTMSNEWDYDDSSSYYYYGTQTSHLVKFSSNGTELDKIEIKNDSDYVYINNFSMSDDYDFYYLDNSYDASNTGGKLMKIAQKSVSLSGTPTCKDVGSFSVDVNATDIHGATSTQSFTLEVTNVNDAPLFENSSAVVTEGASMGTVVKTLSASDCDSGDSLTYSIVSGNDDNHFSLDPTTGELTVAGNISILNKQSYLLEVKATDATDASDNAYVTISVADADLVPQATNDEFVTNEENNTTINPLQNDNDGDNNIDPLGLTITKQPSNGKATIKDNGTIVYVPNKDFYGEEVITYTIKDKTNLVSNEANATIVVNNVNDAPKAFADVVNTPEDVPVIFLPIKNDTDADGSSDIVGLTITTQPAHGDFNITNGEIKYTPSLNFYGTDSFEYKVTDGNGTDSQIVKSYIIVAEVNDIPVAKDDTMETNEDTNVTFAILDNDWDDHSIIDAATSIEIIKEPSNGKLTKEDNGTVTYSPNLNFYGNDSFEYSAYDNNGTMSLPATVKVTVNPINDAPVANDNNYTIEEDAITTFGILNNDTDVENELTTEISITQTTQNGQLKVLDGGKVLYVPTSNYNGTDSFKYTVEDEKGAVSNSATVNINITPIDDAPTLSTINNYTNQSEDVDFNITLEANDLDGDDINYTVSSSDTSIANVSIVDGKVVVTPVENATGTITVEVNATAAGQTATQSFDIEIVNVNDTPTLSTISNISKEEDFDSFNITINPSDVDSDNLKLTVDMNDTSIISIPSNSTDWISSGTYNSGLTLPISAIANKYGVTELNVTVQDPSGEKAVERFTITVNSKDDAPVASSMAATVGPNSVNTFDKFTPNFSDVDGDMPNTLKIETLPTVGTFEEYNVSGDGNWTQINSVPFEVSMADLANYRFNAGDNSGKSADVNWSIRTTTLWSNTATGVVTIIDPSSNNAPDVNISTATDSNISEDIISIDEDGKTDPIYITFSDDYTQSKFLVGIVDSNDTSKVSLNDGDINVTRIADDNVSVIITAKANVYGDVNITLGAFDGDKNGTKTFTLKINPINDIPSAFNFEKTINEDNNYSFSTLDPTSVYSDTNDSSQDNNELYPNIFQIVTLPQHGQLDLNDSTTALTADTNVSIADLSKLTYRPSENNNTNVSFTWRAYDGEAWTLEKTATFNINAVDDAPVFVNSFDTININEDGTISDINLTSYDVENNTIVYNTSSSNSNIATVSIVNGKLVVTPIENASGTVTIEVNATANGLTTSQEFNLTIDAVNDAPTFTTNLSDITINEDNGTISYELNATDIEGDSLTITVESNDTSILKVSPSWDMNELVNQATWNTPLDFNLTTVPNANGVVTITVKADDQDKNSISVFTVNVNPVNDAPTISSISNTYVYRDTTTKSIILDTNDIDTNTLDFNATYTNSELISDISFIENNMTVTITNELSGKSDINVIVSDGELNVTESFIFNVLALKEDDGIKENGIVEVDENETITVTFDENETITVTAQTKPDSNNTVSHEIDLGNGDIIKATSDLNGSVVEPTENGVHTTYSDGNISIEVNATITGFATHLLDINGTKTQATSEIVGAQTTIKENNETKEIEIETTVTNNNISFKVVAKQNGEAEHTVKLQNGKVSKATSKVKGAKTLIKENGSVETTASKDTKTAKVVTKDDGTNTIEFNDGNQIIKPLPDGSSFEADSNATIEDINGSLQITIQSPLTQPLKF